MQTIDLNLTHSIALTLLLLVGGNQAVRRIGFLQRFSIPAPVIGGFVFALLILAVKEALHK